MDRRHADAEVCGDRPHGGAALAHLDNFPSVEDGLWPAANDAPVFGRSHPGLDALTDDLALELGHSRQDVQQQAARGIRLVGVNPWEVAMNRMPWELSAASCSLRCNTLRPNRSSFHTRTASNLRRAASFITRSSSGRLAFAPLQPVSTYSPAIVQCRLAQYSLSSRSWSSQCWSTVETRA